jgi:hypothetical protein
MVLAINGRPTRDWLRAASETTFGGNRRGRIAEAATELALGSPLVHRLTGAGTSLTPRLQAGNAAPRDVTFAFLPMTDARARAMTAAINRADLPGVIAGARIGTLRIGAFAPQYDPVFIAANDAATRKPGATDDSEMLAGYCAVTVAFTARYDAIAHNADVVVLDLRGNLGGFDRIARLEADAISPAPLPRTFDFSAADKPGTVRLTEETRDPSCGHVHARRPLVVLDDAATRSAGEFMATWLWAAGAAVAGERTIGAGGGYTFGAQGFALPVSGFRVRASSLFSIFDCTALLHDGDRPEKDVVATFTADRFSSSRAHPFAIQSVGLSPDIAMTTTLADLRDGGVSEVTRAVAQLRAKALLH